MDKLKNKVYDENHSQFQFTFSYMNQRLSLMLTDPLDTERLYQ